jgi:hypothetical protein
MILTISSIIGIFAVYIAVREIRDWRKPLTGEEAFIKRRIEQLRGE